ncbi:hypothetical protein AB7441_23475 [Providencia rettgeri]
MSKRYPIGYWNQQKELSGKNAHIGKKKTVLKVDCKPTNNK